VNVNDPHFEKGETKLNRMLKTALLMWLLTAIPFTVFPQSDEREKAMDMKVHIEEGVIRAIPDVPRLCDSMDCMKDKIDIGGCKLYCEQEGEGMPLVLVNGGPGSTHHYFHPFFSRAGKFARVIYYDQRGCGLSDYNPDTGYTLDQAVDDLERLRKALNIEQWVVLGHSYGGLLGQCYAMKYPESLNGLVLVCASTGIRDQLLPGREQAFISQAERDKKSQIRNTPGLNTKQIVFNIHLNGDWKRQHYYRPSMEQLARTALYGWIHDNNFNSIMSRTVRSVELEGAFKRCPIPTLIMEGKWDMSWNTDKPKKLLKNHPRAKLVMFKASAHNPFEDEPDMFFEELQKFMKKLPGVSKNKLASWKKDLDKRKRELLESPEAVLNSVSYGRESNAKIAEYYTRNWLERLNDSGLLLKLGFALYDVGDYKEALKAFKRMEKTSGSSKLQAIALIWQGHMLDLLKKRKDAIKVYKKVADQNVRGSIQHAQFGMTYLAPAYARERIVTPFTRIENRWDD
jgi:proline iminopeptidase